MKNHVPRICTRCEKCLKYFSALVLAGVFFTTTLCAQTYLRTNSVSGGSQLSSALSTALPGDLVLLANGNYSGFTIIKSGTAANPIAIQAANLLLATNNAGIIKFAGVSNVILSGLTITTSGGGMTVDGASRYVGMALTNCLNCRVTHSDFKITGAHSGTAWVMIGGSSYSNRVDHCDFGPNNVGGGTHFIWPVGNATIPGVTAPSDRTPWALGYGPFNPNIARYTHIDHNCFHDEGSGDGEIMVLGAIGDTGDYQDTHTLVEYNFFQACDGDAEIISVKSSSNTLRYNTVTNSSGVFSLRAGNNDSVYGNFFLCGGTGGGIKLSERDHKIFNNYIENTDTGNYPIMLESGNLYNIGFAHAQVVRAQIIHNTVVNAGRQVLFAHSGPLPVVDTVFANNIITAPAGKTIFTESVASMNPVFLSNIVWAGNNPNKSGFLYTSPEFTGASPQRLLFNSPAINAANADFYPYVTDDMDGQPRNIPRDIGADEYYAGAFIAHPPLTTNEVGPNSVDIELSASPLLQTVNIGATNADWTINVNSDLDFTGTVTLTVSGLLPGMSAGFNPLTVNGSGTVTLNVTNSSTVLGGNYPMIITATSGKLQSSMSIALQVGRGAANLRWASPDSGAWDIQNTSNWFNLYSKATDSFYNGDTVLLDDAVGVQTNLTIAAGVAVSPSTVMNNSSLNNFTISGSGKITGATKFVKTGSSTLTLNTTNDFGGGILVAGGTLKSGNPYALGGQGGFIIVTNGATLDVNGNNLGFDTVLVSGSGKGGNGAIINNGADVYPALAVMEMAGNTTIGGTHRWDLRAVGGTGGNPATASLSTSGHAYYLTKTGTNFFGLVSATVDPSLGNVNLAGGTLDFEGNTTGLGNPNNTLTVFANATFELWKATNQLNKKIVLNDGANIQNGSGANVLIGQITLNGNDIFNIGGASLTCSNNLAGSGNLIKAGGAILNLAGANTFTGDTIISNGTLAVVGSGTISHSAIITVAAGAMLDVGGRSDGLFTLAAGQALNGDGVINGSLSVDPNATVSPGNISATGFLKINGTMTLQGTTSMKLDKSGGTNDVLQSGAGMIYGGTLNLINLSGGLKAGDNFKLFDAASYSGAFTIIAPTIPAAGLRWDTNGLSHGVLNIVSASPPEFNGIAINGNNLIISVTNGTPDGVYYLLSATNVTLPLEQWQRIMTNVFDANGGFQFTNRLNPGLSGQFFRYEGM